MMAMDEDDAMDPMTVVHAWSVRMGARFGPKVWDQEQHTWLTWEEALSRDLFGHRKRWLLGTQVWDDNAAKRALEWEWTAWWPAWAVKAHLVHTRPCEFEDHKWRLIVDEQGTRLVCDNPCEDPRIYIDGTRYVYPACQNIPDVDQLKFEIEVSPEWVYHSEEEWWVELNGEVLQEKPGWAREKHPEWFTPSQLELDHPEWFTPPTSE